MSAAFLLNTQIIMWLHILYTVAINANYCSSAASTITKPNQTADQENQDIFIFRNAIILHVKFKVKKYESLRSRAKNRTIYL